MNLFDTIRGLVRRWYVSIPGVLLAVVAAVGVWQITPPEFARSASQLLLPGRGVLPDGASNRFMYTGGLAPVADILIRAMGSDDALNDIYEEYPGTQVEIVRDPFASGPVVLITVTTRDDSTVRPILDELVGLTEVTLERLQEEEGIPDDERATVTLIAIDGQSTIRERNRLVMSAAVGLAVALLAVVAASVVDGLVSRSGRRKEAAKQAKSGPQAPERAKRERESAGEGFERVSDQRRRVDDPSDHDTANAPAEGDGKPADMKATLLTRFEEDLLDLISSSRGAALLQGTGDRLEHRLTAGDGDASGERADGRGARVAGRDRADGAEAS